MQRGQIADVDNQPAAAAARDHAHLQRRFEALADLAVLIAGGRPQDHAGIGDGHRGAGILKSACIDVDLRLRCSVAVGTANDRQIGRQRLHVRMEQRGEAGDVHDRVETELYRLTEHVLCALQVCAEHLARLARIGGH